MKKAGKTRLLAYTILKFVKPYKISQKEGGGVLSLIRPLFASFILKKKAMMYIIMNVTTYHHQDNSRPSGFMMGTLF